MKNKILRYLTATLIIVMVGWMVITLYVEMAGPPKQWTFGHDVGKKALIVYDPDPFYNLDEQVCLAFAKSLANDSVGVTVATVKAAEKLGTEEYSLIVYCANTYNWRPDWAMISFIRDQTLWHKHTPIVAITLGAGSTEASQRALEMEIVNTGGKLLESNSLWLWRPNDETRLDNNNVDVAVEIASQWGSHVAAKIND